MPPPHQGSYCFKCYCSPEKTGLHCGNSGARGKRAKGTLSSYPGKGSLYPPQPPGEPCELVSRHGHILNLEAWSSPGGHPQSIRDAKASGRRKISPLRLLAVSPLPSNQSDWKKNRGCSASLPAPTQALSSLTGQHLEPCLGLWLLKKYVRAASWSSSSNFVRVNSLDVTLPSH